jgi:hypothetical protein
MTGGTAQFVEELKDGIKIIDLIIRIGRKYNRRNYFNCEETAYKRRFHNQVIATAVKASYGKLRIMVCTAFEWTVPMIGNEIMQINFGCGTKRK